MEVPLGKKTAQVRFFISENEIIPVRSAFVEACEDFVTGDYYRTGNKYNPIVWESSDSEFISFILPVKVDQSKFDKLKAALCKQQRAFFRRKIK